MKFTPFRTTALFLSILLLAACGGGGGSSSNPYTAAGGITAPAALNTDNGATIALDVYDAGVSGGSAASGLPALPIGTAAASSPASASLEGADISRRLVRLAAREALSFAGKGARRPAASFDNTVPGGVSGTLRIYGSINESTGAFSITMVATDYSDVPGETVDGTIRVSGVYDIDQDRMASMAITFSALTFTDLEGGGTITGSIRFAGYDDSTLYVELFLADNVTLETVWLHNVILTGTAGSDLGGSYTTGAISGTIYLQEYGYVTVATPTPFKTYDTDLDPVEGELVITGAKGARIYLLVPDPDGLGDYEIGLDANGDDVWEHVGDFFWGSSPE